MEVLKPAYPRYLSHLLDFCFGSAGFFGFVGDNVVADNKSAHLFPIPEHLLDISPGRIVELQNYLERHYVSEVKQAVREQDRLQEICNGNCTWTLGTCVPNHERVAEQNPQVWLLSGSCAAAV